MSVTTAFGEEFFASLARRVAEYLEETIGTLSSETRWMDVEAAARYLRTTPDAIRGMVKRGQIPVYRTPTGRLLFGSREIDTWVRRARDPNLDAGPSVDLGSRTTN